MRPAVRRARGPLPALCAVVLGALIAGPSEAPAAGLSETPATEAARAPAAGQSEAPAAAGGPELPVAVLVAQDDGRPAVDEAWVYAQLAEANRLLAVVPLRLRRVSLRGTDAFPAHLVTRADRDAAAAGLVRGVINLRVAASLLDVDEPGRVRRGVHWRLRADPRRRCILLSAIAPVGVLAHELGHYLGNGHSATPDNLMSYERTGAPVFLDAAQLDRARRALAEALRARELVPLRGAQSNAAPPRSP